MGASCAVLSNQPIIIGKSVPNFDLVFSDLEVSKRVQEVVPQCLWERTGSGGLELVRCSF